MLYNYYKAQIRFFQTNNKRKGWHFINYDIIMEKKKKDNKKENFAGTAGQAPVISKRGTKER